MADAPHCTARELAGGPVVDHDWANVWWIRPVELRYAAGVVKHYCLAIVSILVLACSGNQKAAPAKDSSGQAKQAPASTGSLVDQYLAIQTLLADDKVDDLPKLAAQVIAAAEPLQSQPGVDQITQGAGRAAAKDIATARAGFQKMSMGLIAYLKGNPELQKGYEVAFCPMAFNNKGAYWVQAKGELINPYHGKMMLHCGDHVPWDKAP